MGGAYLLYHPYAVHSTPMTSDGTTGNLFDEADGSAETESSSKTDEEPSIDSSSENGSALQDEGAASSDETSEGDEEDVATIEEGKILDYISGEPVNDRPKERVRQKTARALVHEFGIRPEDMETDLRVTLEIGGKSTWRQLEIGIWDPEDEHKQEKMKRAVVCEKEPSSNGTTKIKTHEQAGEDLEELKAFMAALPECKYGLWTNGLDLFYLKKTETRFDTKFEPIGDWPPADDSLELQDVLSNARMRAAEPEMLKTTFRRCHNFIHGNEGMQKGKAFWQFLHLIFSKMHDEETHDSDQRQFWAGPTERFTEEGRKKIRSRVEPLFEQAKQAYDDVFKGDEQIELSDRALAFMVSELSKYDFIRTKLDAKGTAYQEIVGSNLRGDRGQYFTPRGVVDMAVEMLDPDPDERLLDPACGTGGFLVSSLSHIMEKLRNERDLEPGDESSEEFFEVKEALSRYADTNLFGADFDPDLVRATTMNIAMATGESGNAYHIDSLAFPNGHLDAVERARQDIPLGSIDVLLTNPPFGADIPISDPDILNPYELAKKWEQDEDGTFRNSGDYKSSVAPEILFIEQSIRWLKPGGRMAIVLPNGVLGNPADEHIRRRILDRCYILASVEVPIESFIVEANVNIHTTVLFLKKKTEEERQLEALGKKDSYPVFMAVAETCGVDRRGNPLYERHPNGEEVVEEVSKIETVVINGEEINRKVRRKEKVIDNDLPKIAKNYRRFRSKNPEPGK